MQATSIDDLTDRSAAPPSMGDAPDAAPTSRGHVGRIVVGTMVGGLMATVVAVLGPFAGAQEHVITGSMLVVFAVSWALLATLTSRHTDQPQRWAAVPATVMGAAGASMLLFAPTGNELGWVWPPAVLALVVWMVRRARRDLRSRARIFVLYPVFVVLAVSAAGGAIETYAEAHDPGAGEMPGRLVSVGDHRLHIDCTGTGSPTVVLEAGLAEISTMMSAWLAPDLATTTRVCVYDRAGRGWSESAKGPQDGEQVAADLHTLLHNAGEQGPFVLAGHSAGGIYVLNFAKLHPDEVAGVALLDAMHPEQYDRMASWSAFYEMFRRGSALMPTIARLGIGRLAYGGAFGDLPDPQRDLERRLIATPQHARSVRDEFRMIRTAMDQSAELQDLGDLPLVVLTAERDADSDWAGMQDDLATLSSDTLRWFLPEADHTTVVEDDEAAAEASDAILALVEAIRTDTPVAAEGR